MRRQQENARAFRSQTPELRRFLSAQDREILYDIADRKWRKEMPTGERDLLRTLLDGLPAIIFVEDAESRFVTSKTDFDFYPREQTAEYYADEQEAIRSGQPAGRLGGARCRPDVENFWLSTARAPLRDGDRSIRGLLA